ncbi:spore germination protein [Numidum massiliense]|uniref:spore germination protein n=1 Tax=Numidum massiliense TaxID=1522315 RepID=UPI0006D5592C|nr:spore germination protein [Numidum massiliense]
MNREQNQKLTQQNISTDLAANVELLNEVLGVGSNYDVIYRPLKFAKKPFAMYFINGFIDSHTLDLVNAHLSELKPEQLTHDTIVKMLKTYLCHSQVELVEKLSDVVDNVLTGPLVMLMDGSERAFVIDVRHYPGRSPEEPDIERVVRGARDGFTENIVVNTVLTRRRLRDPSLRFEVLHVGQRSKTDVVLAYLKDVADPDLVHLLKDRIDRISIDGLPMAEKSLEEFIFKRNWNPYPLARYTERPDVAAVHLLEGHVLMYVDTSPSVMITPATLFHHVQHAEEYRQKPIVGAYLRWVRFFAMLLSLFLLPAWYLLASHPGGLPASLSFVGIEKPTPIPLMAQFLLAEVGADVLRLASIHTPSPLASALGLVSAILIGQVAVTVGLFVNEVILYLAIAVIGQFATPSYEFGLANKLVRIFFLLCAWAGGWLGFVFGVALWIALLLSMRSLNVPYLWPLIPFNGSALLDVLVRSPIPMQKNRPSALSPQDVTRQ